MAWAFQKRSRPQQEALQASVSEGLAQGPYVAARAGFEPEILLSKGIDSTNAPPHPTDVRVVFIFYSTPMGIFRGSSGSKSFPKYIRPCECDKSLEGHKIWSKIGMYRLTIRGHGGSYSMWSSNFVWNYKWVCVCILICRRPLESRGKCTNLVYLGSTDPKLF